MKNFLNSLETKRAAMKEEGGFSLIDVVVTVAIIVALSVGGFVAYSGIVDSAKSATTGSAADQVRTALVVADNDNDAATTHTTVIDGFNLSATGVTVDETNAAGVKTANGGYVTAKHADFKDATSTPKLIKTIKLG